MEWDVTIVIRLLVAVVCGGLIGFEREMRGRVAGLRTHILVCLGACLIMMVSVEIAKQNAGTDASRIAAQVVSGIGFLGAGAIIRSNASVIGLTTAASVWVVAGIGLACGIGYYEAAVITTVLILVVLFVLSKFQKRILHREK